MYLFAIFYDASIIAKKPANSVYVRIYTHAELNLMYIYTHILVEAYSQFFFYPFQISFRKKDVAQQTLLLSLMKGVKQYILVSIRGLHLVRTKDLY